MAPFANPFGSGCVHAGDDPDLYVYMRQNSNYFYYSGYYPNTWYPNNGYSCSSQPLSFSMYPNNITSPLEVPTRGLFTSPYLAGQTFNYEFLVGDDDQGSFLNIFGGNDYIGSYTLPAFTTSSTCSITTSGTNAPAERYPLLSIANKYPSAQIIGPASNLSSKFIKK